MFVAKCKPTSYSHKTAVGNYAIDTNGKIAVILENRSQNCAEFNCDVTGTTREPYFYPIKYIAKADIIDHFNMNVIYNYRTYTQAFYDIFTLDGDDITLRNKSSSSNSNSNSSSSSSNSNSSNPEFNSEFNSEFSSKEREQNTLLLEQNALLLEQNGLLLQLLTLRNVPVQADLLQM